MIKEVHTNPEITGSLPAADMKSIEYKWNVDAVFPSAEAWEKEMLSIAECAFNLKKYEGRLGESAETLYRFLCDRDSVSERVDRVFLYAHLKHHENTLDAEGNQKYCRARQLTAAVSSQSAFSAPEILAMPSGKVQSMLEGYEPLRIYTHELETIERMRPHTRSAEVEEVLEKLSITSALPDSVHTSLSNADMTFAPIIKGAETAEVNQGSVEFLLSSADRDTRRQAYQSYWDGYLSLQQTFAQALTGCAVNSCTFASLARFDSTFSRALFAENLPASIFDTVLGVCREHRPLFHRYFRAKAALFGLEKLSEWDVAAPLAAEAPAIDYSRAREMVLGSLQPLGKNYVDVAQAGLTSQRWVDVFAAEGKYNNPFSMSAYGAQPFVLLNYAGNMSEVGTLAHELGHAMHSHLANSVQPYCYHGYASMTAETASNLNQVLLRDYVLKNADRLTTLSVMDEAFYFCHRYLFLMPTLSEVEHQLHSTYAGGGAMSAEDLNALTLEAFRKAYGDSVEVDEKRTGIKWAHFCHFYEPYYFFQYAIGISAAMAIGQRILSGEEDTRNRYLEFLKAGGSKHPADIFKIVDIDIASPEPYRKAFGVMQNYVETLEGLIKSNRS